MERKENTNEVALADVHPIRAKGSFKCHRLAIYDIYSLFERNINKMGE